MRVLQVSDAHLSRERAYFVDNWDVLVTMVESDPPDLVVISGDISLDGVRDPAALDFARDEVARLKAPVRILPGNHDIGEHPFGRRAANGVTAERLERWIERFGPDYWLVDAGAWRLIGLDSEIMGSRLPAEARQRAWLEAMLAEAPDRPVALFQHKPLYLADPAESDISANCLDPEARAWLLGLLESYPIRLVSSGHLHIYRHGHHGQTELIWAPATSFVNGQDGKQTYGGIRRLGLMEFTFGESGVSHAFVEPPLFFTLDMQNWFRAGKGGATSLPPRPLCRR